MRRPDLTVPVTLLAVFTLMIATAAGYPPSARLMPLTIGIPAALLTVWEMWRVWRAAPEGEPSTRRRAGQAVALVWFTGFVLAIVAGGFIVGGIAAVVAVQRFWLRESWRTACVGGVVAFVVLAGGIERGLGQPLFEGVVTGWAQGWLGI
ncbi:MAG TPA: hypothetical protein VFO31_22595 [Vicinamibacterales bacterium]|nr:hypothetical protein [Vicinamibacterales bacterium]